jgi:hypothetical protein
VIDLASSGFDLGRIPCLITTIKCLNRKAVW